MYIRPPQKIFKFHYMKKVFTLLFLAFSIFTSHAQERMSAELLWKLGRVSLEDVSPDGKTALYSVKVYDTKTNESETKLYALDIKKGEATAFAANLNGAKYLFNGTKVGGTIDGQYALVDADGNNPQKITLIKGASGWKAIEQNDGGLILLFTKEYKFAKTTQENYPDLDLAEAHVFDDLMYRHWDHWNDEFVDHLHMAKYAGDLVRTSIDLQGNEPFDVGSYTANAQGTIVAYDCKKVSGREYAVSTNTDIYLYDIKNGNTANITSGMMGYDRSPSFSPDGKKLAWTSMPQDGYESDVNKLWVMNMETKEKSQVLSENYVQSFSWINNNAVGYMVPKMATQQIGMIDFGSKKETIITKGDYNYKGFVFAGKSLIAERQDMNHATELYSVNLKKGTAEQITHVNDAIYNNLDMGKIEKRMVKTTDGKDMLTWVIYPPNFDPNKKYPTLLYCQGGPQAPVSQFYSFRWNFQLMAAHDYIIVAPNRRGLPGFGVEWNEAISKDWGGQPMKDYLSAIDEVAKEPFVDNEKLGAVGASYGGYSVYMLAGIHEGRFKALISHCGLFNMESWYGVTEEVFFANWDIGGPYWQNPKPEAYTKFSPHNYVQNWTAPILVIHGGKDFRVPENQGMEAFQAAQLRGIPSKFLYFPNEGHWILQPQNGLIWHNEYFNWLDKWLK